MKDLRWRVQFPHLAFFYGHLRHRLFVILGLSLCTGLMDGLGLAMFIPLLEHTAAQAVPPNPASLGRLGFLVEGLSELGMTPSLGALLSVMFLFFMVKGGVAFYMQYKKVEYSQHFIRTLRERSITALAEYRYEQYARADVGLIQNTLSGEIGKVSQAMKGFLATINSAVLVLVYVGLSLLSNPQFAMLVLIAAWASNRAFNFIYEQTKRLSAQVTKVGHSFQRLLIQQSAHFKYLKATGYIRDFADKMVTDIRLMEEKNRKIGVLGATVSSVREPLIIMSVLVAIFVQVQLLGGKLSLILLSVLLLYRALSHVLALQGEWNGFLASSGSISNLQEFTDDLLRNREVTGARPFDRLRQGISLQHASFQYARGCDVLADVTLGIRRNETVAFVGPSGAGKTTLMNIVVGLLTPQHGSVLVDGCDLRELNTTQYQRRIGYITQDPVIFDDSVFNNVSLWDQDTPETRSRVHHALTQAHLSAYVAQLPDGLEARLGNNGINLSGGQKQRIAIARELYKDVDILLLDEATSSVDSATEAIIKSNIDALKGRYTTLIVAHRLSTIRNADRVVLMRDGKVQQVGSFEDIARELGASGSEPEQPRGPEPVIA